MGEINVRKIRKEELNKALSILSQWNMAPRKASKENPNPERESLILEHTFVAVADNKIVGVCSYLILSSKEAETASLAIDRDYKGSGIGYLLQVERLKEMKARGFKRVHTETDRTETIEWYIRKFGYKKVGTNPKKHDFSLKNVDHWTVLKLDLENINF